MPPLPPQSTQRPRLLYSHLGSRATFSLMPLTYLNPIPTPSPQPGDPELGFATFPSACGGFPGGAVVKHCLPAMQETLRDAGSSPGSGRSPGEGNGNPLQYFLPGESHGQRSLTGYSPRGCNESDTTGVTEHIYTHPVHHTLIATSPETAFHEEITQFYFSTRWPILGVFSSFWDILLKIKL